MVIGEAGGHWRRSHRRCDFGRGGGRPPTTVEVDFANCNKDDVVEGRKLGVELICKVLQVAPSTYYPARDRTPSARTPSDSVLSGELYSLWVKNWKVYGGAETLEDS